MGHHRSRPLQHLLPPARRLLSTAPPRLSTKTDIPTQPPTIRFQLGGIYTTPGALAATTTDEIATALARHVCGDWSEICAEDAATNEDAVEGGGQLMSVYTSASGIVFWVITESDRSVTTLLLPDEY